MSSARSSAAQAASGRRGGACREEEEEDNGDDEEGAATACEVPVAAALTVETGCWHGAAAGGGGADEELLLLLLLLGLKKSAIAFGVLTPFICAAGAGLRLPLDETGAGGGSGGSGVSHNSHFTPACCCSNVQAGHERVGGIDLDRRSVHLVHALRLVGSRFREWTVALELTLENPTPTL